jgi:DNA polymerase-3 subunit delta'
MNHLIEQVGQDRILGQLLELIRHERIGNGYILSGPLGSGKMSLALNFTAALNCKKPLPDLSPCGSCDSCRKIFTNSHPNIHFIFPSPAGKNGRDDDPFDGLSEAEFEPIQAAMQRLGEDPYAGIEVESATTILISMIRKLRKDLMLSAGETGWQVVIVYRADKMNDASSNAMLKILEEPPPKTLFLILTDKINALLPTIRSRCQFISVNPPAVEEIAGWLMKSHDLDEERANYYAHFSNGDIRLVKEFLSMDMDAEGQQLVQFWRYLGSGDMTAVNTWVEEMHKLFKKDKESVRREIRKILFWLRDAQLITEGSNPTYMIHTAFVKELTGFATYFPGVDYLKIIREVERIIELTGKNVYFPALLGHLCLSLIEELAHARSGS